MDVLTGIRDDMVRVPLVAASRSMGRAVQSWRQGSTEQAGNQVRKAGIYLLSDVKTLACWATCYLLITQVAYLSSTDVSQINAVPIDSSKSERLSLISSLSQWIRVGVTRYAPLLATYAASRRQNRLPRKRKGACPRNP